VRLKHPTLQNISAISKQVTPALHSTQTTEAKIAQMSDSECKDPVQKHTVPLDQSVELYAAAAGDLPNHQVKTCYVCKRNGYPHEAISLEKIIGRTLSNGTNEVVGWKLNDYFSGRLHQHKLRNHELPS
jgi:hypothetical protein